MARLQARIDVVEQGYTGQRDQWEEFTHDAIVNEDSGGVVQLLFPGSQRRRIRFERQELEDALAQLDKLKA